jgi:hypothetical protein
MYEEILKDLEKMITETKQALEDVKKKRDALPKPTNASSSSKDSTEPVATTAAEDDEIHLVNLYSRSNKPAKDSKRHVYVDTHAILSVSLSSFLECRHTVLFFIACCHHSLGQTELEEEYYEKASLARTSILRDLRGLVDKVRAQVFEEEDDAAVENEDDNAAAVAKNSKVHGKMVELVGKCTEWFQNMDKDQVHGIVIHRPVKSGMNAFHVLESQWESALRVWRDRIVEILATSVDGGAPSSAKENSSNESQEVDENSHEPSGEEYGLGVELQSELDILLVF